MGGASAEPTSSTCSGARSATTASPSDRRRDPSPGVPEAAGWRLLTTDGERICPFDLVIGADGARSRIRRLSGLASKDVGYPTARCGPSCPDPIISRATRYTSDTTTPGRPWASCPPASTRRPSSGPSAAVTSPPPWPPALRRGSAVCRAVRAAARPRGDLGCSSALDTATWWCARQASCVVAMASCSLGDAAHAMRPATGAGSGPRRGRRVESREVPSAARDRPLDCPVRSRGGATSARPLLHVVLLTHDAAGLPVGPHPTCLGT